MPRLAREMPGEMQLRQVRHGVAVAQAVHAEPDQRADIEREAVLFRTIEADGRPRIGPGAIEQRQRAMVEDIGEALKGRIAMVAPPVARVFRQMQRQRAVRAEQAEEMHQQPRRVAVLLRLQCGERGRGEHDRGFLRQPHRILCRPHAVAEAWPVAILRLEPPHRLIEAVLPRRLRELRQQLGGEVGRGRG